MIRRRQAHDLPGVLAIARELVADGTTYVFAPETSDEALTAYWWRDTLLVADADPDVAGMALVRANQPGRGSHVATAAFAVAAGHRGKGLGRALGEAALAEARAQGFSAMQFNFVVESNPAVRLWESLDFAIVGRVPDAFAHPSGELQAALVMHRRL